MADDTIFPLVSVSTLLIVVDAVPLKVTLLLLEMVRLLNVVVPLIVLADDPVKVIVPLEALNVPAFVQFPETFVLPDEAVRVAEAAMSTWLKVVVDEPLTDPVPLKDTVLVFAVNVPLLLQLP